METVFDHNMTEDEKKYLVDSDFLKSYIHLSFVKIPPIKILLFFITIEMMQRKQKSMLTRLPMQLYVLSFGELFYILNKLLKSLVFVFKFSRCV